MTSVLSISSDRTRWRSASSKEPTISSLGEQAVLVELLERKGILARQDVLGMFETLQRRESTASLPR